MATKKKDYNATEQATAFFQQTQEDHETGTDAGEPAHKTGRPKSRGETKRASIFLDADIATALKVQAALEGKSISVLISEIVRDYLNKKNVLEKLEEFQSQI